MYNPPKAEITKRFKRKVYFGFLPANRNCSIISLDDKLIPSFSKKNVVVIDLQSFTSPSIYEYPWMSTKCVDLKEGKHLVDSTSTNSDDSLPWSLHWELDLNNESARLESLSRELPKFSLLCWQTLQKLLCCSLEILTFSQLRDFTVRNYFVLKLISDFQLRF